MDKYFKTLDATKVVYGISCLANGRKVDDSKLIKAMKSALRRHHNVGAESNHIIKLYNGENND